MMSKGMAGYRETVAKLESGQLCASASGVPEYLRQQMGSRWRLFTNAMASIGRNRRASAEKYSGLAG